MLHKAYDEQICAWLEAHRSEIVAELIALARIPSVRSEPLPGAPFGQECARVLDAAADLFARLGFTPRTEQERGYALGFSGSGEKVMGFFGHADVVPAGEGWRYTQPFDPIEKDGLLIGRGVADNKAGVIAAAYTVALLRSLNLPVRSRLMVYAGSNEETGMGDVQAFAATERCPDISFVPDVTFPCALGQISKTSLWVRCCTPFTAIRDFSGGIGVSAVMPDAYVTMEPSPALETWLRQETAQNDALTLTVLPDGALQLHAKGISAHAAHPADGINAGLLAAKVLRRCDALPESDRAILAAYHDLLGDVYGSGLGVTYTDPLFGRRTCVNGMAATENGCLRVSMDARSGPKQPTQQLEDQLRQVWDDHGWDIAEMSTRPGYFVPEGSPVPELLRSICRDVTGEDRPTYIGLAGTYSCWLPNSYTVGARAPLEREVSLAFPAGYGGAHQPDEYLDIDGLLQAIRILAHTTLQCDELLYQS